jgi:two-component system CheB/CheR fusion protein
MSDLDADDKPSLVVTGSSAGGIDALLALVAGLSADFPAPIVIAQHLDPTHPSRLPAVLAQRSPLPVRLVGERDELQQGSIYVVPPDRDVVVEDGAVMVRQVDRSGPKPSIDRLFATAAESYGDRLVGVIFSGMGNDGLAGARAVKEHGGTVIIQDPETATHPSMPLAIPPTLVDLVGPPDTMGRMLTELLRGTRVPEGSSEQGMLRNLLTQLRDRSGIDFFQYKTPTIMRRLSRLMVASGVESLNEYLRYLQGHPDEYQRLVSAFLIKVTEFFRDAALFEMLKDSVLPKLIEEAAAGDKELRIWSAGTSTGEESYSLAILCAELLRDENSEIGVRIFATDIDEEAVAFARRGLYSAEALRHVPQAWIDRYFVRVGDAFEVGKRIRNMTVFGQHDLGQRAPFPRIDLCVCRNVLIYFTRELQQRALQLFAFSLRDGGFLVLGKAESTTLLSQYFRTVDQGLKVFQRYGDRNVIPPPRLRETITVGLPEVRGPKVGQGGVTSGLRIMEPRPTTNETVGAFFSNAPLGVVVVDRRYDIVTLNPAARTLLELHGVGIGEDLVHLARAVDPHTLRGLIDTAFRREPSRLLEVPLLAEEATAQRCLQIVCWADSPTSSAPERVALFITDVTESVAARRKLENVSGDQASEIATVSERNRELQARQKVLLDANDELTSANAELRHVNEQLLINAEEAASANEEIETLNEELQATNEELETLNEELQATVEELNTTNDELEARSNELERLNTQREASLERADADRAAMAAALAAVPEIVAIVDQTGRGVFANEAVASWVAAKTDGWWDGKDPARIGERTYRLEPVELNLPTKNYHMIVFRPS